MDKKSILIGFAVVVILLIGGLVYLSRSDSASSTKLDGFATCIKDSGATFYGAFWCPHCQATKKMFAASAKLLPYVECSTPDKKEQTQVCKDAKVESYPTWEFKDKTRMTGELTLEQLAEKTECQLPEES